MKITFLRICALINCYIVEVILSFVYRILVIQKSSIRLAFC